MEYIISSEKIFPIEEEYDVVVLGGGPAGVSAAVSAAKANAKTALVERYGYLGGQATGGLVILIVGLTNGKERIIKGFCEDTINRLEKLNAAQNVGNHILFDPESLKYVFDCFLEENKVTPYYHNFISGVIKEEDKVSGIIIDGKSGKRLLKAKNFVDATGDADIAKYCGMPFEQKSKQESLPVTLGFRVGGIDTQKAAKFVAENHSFYQKLLHDIGISTKIGGWIHTTHKNEAWFNISNIENIDITNSDDLTRAEIIGRSQIQKIIDSFKNSISGFEEGYLIDTASQIGIRDSRRIKGIYYFTEEDAVKTFSDSIAKAPDYTGTNKDGSVQIPYGCLISQGIKNVIFAGRCISVEHKLLDMFREIPCCMATGQAAGIAASIAAQKNYAVQTINIKELQKILIGQGALF